MISRFITGPIMGALAAVLAIAFAVQTIRIDGLPIFYDGLRMQLAACETARLTANEAAGKAAEKAREDGRAAALADADKLAGDRAKERESTAKTISDLQSIVARLQRPQPPVTVRVEGEPPVIATPPVSQACLLDKDALGDLRERLNRGRL